MNLQLQLNWGLMIILLLKIMLEIVFRLSSTIQTKNYSVLFGELWIHEPNFISKIKPKYQN